MNKKLFLTSFVAIGFATSAMGATTLNADGTMSAATTYTPVTPWENVTGKTSGTAPAGAIYRLASGYYFPANSYTAAACPANSYCSGGGSILRGPGNLTAQGATACPSPYTLSAGGTSTTSLLDCYKACTLDSATTTALISNAHDYYGGGNTCAANTCKSGYRKSGVDATGREWIPFQSAGCMVVQSAGGPTYAHNYSNECLASTDLSVYGLNSAQGLTWAYQQASAFSNPTLGKGIVYGDSKCSASSDAFSTATLSGTGNNCWCQFKGMKFVLDPATKTLSDLYPVTSQWIRAASDNLGSNCSSMCADACANTFVNGIDRRGDSGDSSRVLYVPAMQICAPATYKITYKCGKRPAGTAVSGDGAIGYATYGTSYTTKNRGGTTGVSCLINTRSFTLTGWSETVDGAKVYDPGQTINSWGATGDKTYYAIWTAVEAEIKFIVTGATSNGTIANKTLGVSVDVAMPSISGYTMPTKKGYNLTGFWSNITGTNTKYYNADKTAAVQTWPDAAQENTVEGTPVQMTAGWSAKTMTVSYSCGTGTGTKPDNHTATYDQAFTTAQNNKSTPCSKTGYTFAGWTNNSTNVNAGASYAAANWANSTLVGGDTGSEITLTARYTANGITINWYGTASNATVGGNSMGTCSGESTTGANCKSSSVSYGADITTPSAAATITGQSFLGWKFIK